MAVVKSIKTSRGAVVHFDDSSCRGISAEENEKRIKGFMEYVYMTAMKRREGERK